MGSGVSGFRSHVQQKNWPGSANGRSRNRLKQNWPKKDFAFVGHRCSIRHGPDSSSSRLECCCCSQQSSRVSTTQGVDRPTAVPQIQEPRGTRMVHSVSSGMCDLFT